MKFSTMVLCVLLVAAGPASQPTSQPSDADKRVEIIDKLQKEGVFGEIVLQNKIVKAVVKPRFYSLEYKMKQSFCGVLLAWGLDQDPGCVMVRLKDSKTDRVVGSMDKATGKLKMDD